jgi:hypothetical protein
MQGETRVCPFCGAPPGPAVFCAACGRNLAAVERLPTAREFAAHGEDVPATVAAFLEAMHAAGDPGTVEVACDKPRAFRRTPQLTGWIVLPVEREDFESPRRYEPGLLLSVEGTFHRLDSELRGHGTRYFPRYEQRVSAEPVEPAAEQHERILDALTQLRPAG